jgi:hypothetical protein
MPPMAHPLVDQLRFTRSEWLRVLRRAAIRQVLGHVGVPEFVGDIDGDAPYRREDA